jgi:hypothetical protein
MPKLYRNVVTIGGLSYPSYNPLSFTIFLSFSTSSIVPYIFIRVTKTMHIVRLQINQHLRGDFLDPDVAMYWVSMQRGPQACWLLAETCPLRHELISLIDNPSFT